ncbi:EF-hand calcium-binding domain-containing protein 6-like isoform X2 [Heterodontus francisci]|uniref:EF-hand calcium-binding domain-containing protein 6-like isoform X2 n=1 Tax=Heterodontus francisci TaxID=7792 RepID=UPI00355ADA70
MASFSAVTALIREKLNSSFHTVQRMFQASDPKGAGTVSKEALTRILWNLCGYLNTQQVNDLLGSLGIAGLSRFSFGDFASCFQDTEVGKTEWIKNVQLKQLQENGTKNPNNCFLLQKTSKVEENTENHLSLLKQKVHESGFSMEAHFEPSCLNPGGVIKAEQLKQALHSMGFVMNNEEFNSLWLRISKERKLEIPTAQLLNELGINCQQSVHCGSMDLVTMCRIDSNEDSARSPTAKYRHNPSNSAADSSEDIIKILKDKMEEACEFILHEFAKYDKETNGLMSKTAFRHALVDLKISMFAMDLEHLLSRLNLRRKDGYVDYVAFLGKLQSRSNLSLFHKMMQRLSPSDGGSLRAAKCSLTASEAVVSLLNQCHRLYLQLLAAFRKVEISGQEAVSIQAFKEIIEKNFQIELSENQLNNIVTRVGGPQNNLVSYPKFLCLFQNRPSTGELKQEVGQCSLLMRDKNMRIDRIRYIDRFGSDWVRYSHAQKPRSLPELRALVWGLLQRKFRSFCKVFINVCINDECTADKEKLDSVLLRMNVILLPMELEKLWYSLPISYPVEAISLRKFLRHFSRLKKVKDSGENNLQQNPVTHIQNKLRRDIIKHWNDLKSVLKERDPHGTGRVSFRDIQALCLSLKWNLLPTEVDKLCAAYDLDKNAEFHYIPFMKSYTKKEKAVV